MNYDFLMRQAMQQYLAETAKKPRLTIVSNETNTNQGDATMDEPTDQPQSAARPFHEHGAFNDIEAAVDILVLGADALKGIGNIMMPGMTKHDEQLDMAHRSDLSAIFRFFGEVLGNPARDAEYAAERLARAAQGEVS